MLTHPARCGISARESGRVEEGEGEKIPVEKTRKKLLLVKRLVTGRATELFVSSRARERRITSGSPCNYNKAHGADRVIFLRTAKAIGASKTRACEECQSLPE